MGGSGGGFDEDRQWRREGPLPPSDDARPPRRGFGGGGGGYNRDGPSQFDEDRGERMGFGSRFQPSGDRGDRGDRERSERQPPPPSIAEENTDWRASAKAPPPRGPPPGALDEAGGPGMRRRGSNFGTGPDRERDPASVNHPSETEDKWSIGSRFKPAPEPSGPFGGRKFGGPREGGPREGGPREGGLREGGPREGGPREGGPREGGPNNNAPLPPTVSDNDNDWRSAPRKAVAPPPGPGSRRNSHEKSPSGGFGGPPVRRKLELLPRSSTTSSAVGSPLASPKSAAAVAKPNPFGDARPVDVAVREKEISEKIERQRPASAWGGSQRGGLEPGSRQPSAPPSEAGGASPKPSVVQILSSPSGETAPAEPNPPPVSTSAPAPAVARASQSVAPPPATESVRRSVRAPPPPLISRDSAKSASGGGPKSSGPPTGGLKPAFSFAKAAGGGNEGAWRKAPAPTQQSSTNEN